MYDEHEKAAFAQRLRIAMRRAPKRLPGAAALARHFNRHYGRGRRW
jgi:hypothetical protein